jgi:spore germination protein
VIGARNPSCLQAALRVMTVVVVIALATGCGSRPISTAGDSRRLLVTGYAAVGTAPGRVAASARALVTLGVDGVNISADGAEVPMPDSGDLALLRQARKAGIRAEFLVGNYSDRLGDFDPAAARALLGSPANIRHVAAVLARAVASQGWSGIAVDFEALSAGDRAGLVAFVATLKKYLPRGRTVSVDVAASTSRRQYAAGGYDLSQLGEHADRIVLMAYDEDGPTWSGAGPVGGLPWQEAVLEPVLRVIPPGRIDLGVAGYGYTWPRRGTGVQVSDSQARQMVRAGRSRARWDAAQGEWTATLRDGTVMWWSDARSWALRVSLARSRRLHGLALWSLGLSDPLIAP